MAVAVLSGMEVGFAVVVPIVGAAWSEIAKALRNPSRTRPTLYGRFMPYFGLRVFGRAKEGAFPT